MSEWHGLRSGIRLHILPANRQFLGCGPVAGMRLGMEFSTIPGGNRRLAPNVKDRHELC
jgi:hypothetical protein